MATDAPLTASELDGLTFTPDEIVEGSAVANGDGSYTFTAAIDIGSTPQAAGATATLSNGNDTDQTVTVTINGGALDGRTSTATLVGNTPTSFLLQGSALGLGGYVLVSNQTYQPTPGTQVTVGALSASNPYTAPSAPCFAAGTLIRTSRGEVPVEALRVGDEVLTASGALRPVVWLGHRKVDCARHPRPEKVWPVRVAAGAFGPGLPARDLWLSPDHAVYAEGVLIPAGVLADGGTVAQVRRASVTYWHVELDRHDVILAEGLACESYLDTGNRGQFAGDMPSLHPDFTALSWEDACAPLCLAGAAVEAVRARLDARARAAAA